MRKWLIAFAVVLVALTSLVAATPLLVYVYWVGRIAPTSLEAPRTFASPAAARYWWSLGGSGRPEMRKLDPYTIIFDAGRGRVLPLSAPDRLSVAAARVIELSVYRRIRLRQFQRHMLGASAMIWASRNWTADRAIDTVLQSAYFGNGFFGIERAARGYFGLEEEELSDAQLALLMASMHSPERRNPWKRVDEAREKAREILRVGGVAESGVDTARLFPAPGDVTRGR